MEIRKLWPVLGLSLVLGGCGGGSSGSGTAEDSAGTGSPGAGSGGTGSPGMDPSDPTFGIDAGGLVYGVLTAFGSVVVNGVRYDTSNAQIFVQGLAAGESDLRVGDVVQLQGAVNDDGVTGTAQLIRTDSLIEGPVESVDVDSSLLQVLGQPVTVRSTTSFDDDFFPRSLEGVATGMRVEIDGFISADGQIVATRIEREDDDDDYEVRGIVTGLDLAARRFKLNDLEIDFSQAQLDDFPTNGIRDGDLVEVEGDRLEGTLLFAREVDFEGNFLQNLCPRGSDDDDDCFVEVEGYISRFDSPADFDVGGVRIIATADTVFEDGSSADLALGRKVEIDGLVDAEGRLTAFKIEFEDDSAPIEIDARVTDVDDSAGIITLLGIQVKVDQTTRLEDFSSSLSFPFRPGDIRVGDWLEISGRPLDSGEAEVLATKIEREDGDDQVELQGFVESVAAPDFTILGVTIQTTSDTEFEGADDELTQAQFFDVLQIGDLVETQGVQLADTVIRAEDVEIEDDTDD